jgi:hypothetical protein
MDSFETSRTARVLIFLEHDARADPDSHLLRRPMAYNPVPAATVAGATRCLRGLYGTGRAFAHPRSTRRALERRKRQAAKAEGWRQEAC